MEDMCSGRRTGEEQRDDQQEGRVDVDVENDDDDDEDTQRAARLLIR